MEGDRRKELRFPLVLNLAAKQANRDSILGQTKDVSRSGLGAVFEDFVADPQDYVDLKIQLPEQDLYFPASAEVRWKRPVEDKWEVGFRFNDFIPQIKAEILEYAYRTWLRTRAYSS